MATRVATPMDMPVTEAFAFGKVDPETPRYRNPTLAIREAREAVDSWTQAQSDHAHTSYYGARGVRAMRAYWLGRLRMARTLEPCRSCGVSFPYDPEADYCPTCASVNAGEEPISRVTSMLPDGTVYHHPPREEVNA